MPKQPVPCRKIWVHKAVGIHLVKILIESVNLARMKICCIQEIVTVGDAERSAFVNGAVNAAVRAVIDGDNSVRRIHRRVPT